MRITAFLALFGIIMVGVLGFVAIHDRHGNGTFCISDVVIPRNCPKVESAAFHAAIYQSLTVAVVSAVMITLLFVALAVSLDADKSPALSFISRSENYELVEPKAQKNQTDWFKVHEKRDPAGRI